MVECLPSMHETLGFHSWHQTKLLNLLPGPSDSFWQIGLPCSFYTYFCTDHSGWGTMLGIGRAINSEMGGIFWDFL
jgi:hypothetical protein